MKKMLRLAVAVISIMAAAPTLAAITTTTVFVPGNANPNFAGQASGTCCSGDSATTEPPILALTSFAEGTSFTFAASGFTDGAGTGVEGPDGQFFFNMTDYGLGIAPASGVRILGLLGVFLDGSMPVPADQPAGLNFSSGLDFATLAPGLKQMFWIGDGLTGTGTGASQTFVAPTGATRLYLATVDGFGWANNTGGYDVAITYDVAPVPEPEAYALMLVGLGLMGFVVRNKRQLQFSTES